MCNVILQFPTFPSKRHLIIAISRKISPSLSSILLLFYLSHFNRFLAYFQIGFRNPFRDGAAVADATYWVNIATMATAPLFWQKRVIFQNGNHTKRFCFEASRSLCACRIKELPEHCFVSLTLFEGYCGAFGKSYEVNLVALNCVLHPQSFEAAAPREAREVIEWNFW